jgi:hypothetical protein
MPVILAIKEAEIRRISIRGQLANGFVINVLYQGEGVLF